MAHSFSDPVATFATLEQVAGMLPKPAAVAPPAEAGAGAAGSGAGYLREDHKHPKLGVGLSGVLDANGTRTIAFGMTFPTEPGLSLSSVKAGGAVNFDVDWVRENPAGATEALKGGYVGAVIKGYRGRSLPVLTALLTGVVSALSGYDPFAGSAAGVGFTGSVRMAG